MKIFIIYDSRCPEKEPLFKEELKRQRIEDYEIFPAIVLSHSVVESISASFKSIISKAKEEGLEEVCIMEDDIEFPNENGWKYFLENKPKEFDIYVGGNYLLDIRTEYKNGAVKVNNYVGNQMIIVHSRYFDKWLATDSKKHCDGEAHKGNANIYTCFPFVALQKSGLKSSNNNFAPQFYNREIKKEYIY